MKILFLCVQNSARSQMAEGWGRALAPPGTQVFSAGSSPLHVRPQAIEVMAEVGIDIRSHTSQGLDEVPLGEMDCAITLCAEEVCPVVVGLKHHHWPIPDPAGDGKTLADFRAARDEIRRRVDELFSEMS